MKAVVLTLDRLPASLLGCYGNEWIETPHFDRLAAESIVFPAAFAEIAAPASAEHPWWTGQFEFFRGETDTEPSGTAPTLFQKLTEAGVTFCLLSERSDGLPPRGVPSPVAPGEPGTPASPVAPECSSRDGSGRSGSGSTAGSGWFEVVSGEDGLDVEHSRVPFAQLVCRAVSILDGPADGIPDLLWLHSRGVPSPWLAPEFFSGLYLDELEDQDESAASGREIADALLDQLRADPELVRLLLADPADDADDDEDAAAGLITEELGAIGDRVAKFVFAGYVSLIDHWLKRLLDAVAHLEDTLLIVTAAGGVTFGERAAFLTGDPAARRLAEADDDVCDSLFRVPLLVRPPGRAAFGNRSMRMALPGDVCTTLLECLTGCGVRNVRAGEGRKAGCADGSVTGEPSAAISSSPRPAGVNLLLPAPDASTADVPAVEFPVSDVPSVSVSGSSVPGSSGSGSSGLAAEVEAGGISGRPALHLGRAGTLAIRAGDWLLTVPDGLSAVAAPAEPDGRRSEAVEARFDDVEDRAGLYLQPEDRWCLNNVARQYGSVCSRLFEELRRRSRRAAAGEPRPDVDLLQRDASNRGTLRLD